MQPEPPICWLFSMTRSGSSVSAYAAAHALGACVLDEPLGPWDRTGPPYGYPALQKEVQRSFAAAKGQIDQRVAGQLRTLCHRMAHRAPAGVGPVVVKLPHLQITPEAFEQHFPDWRAAWLIRNPLRRLNSLYTRRWNHFTYDHHDLEAAREYARRWIAAPPEQRLVYEQLQRNPHAFFRSLFRAWGLPASDERVQLACEYRAAHYHESSAQLHHARRPTGVLSDHRRHVPLEAARLYLGDPLIAALFDRLGWDSNPATYSEEADDQPPEPLDERIRQPPVGEPSLR